MLISFRNISIRKKLTALMMMISILILLLVYTLYITEEVYSSRSFLKREMTTLGATLGGSCKKLLIVKDIAATHEILSSLKVQPNIRAAYLFAADGEAVAQYLDPSDTQFLLKYISLDFADPETKFWADLTQHKLISSWQHFGLFLPIEHDGRQIGSIYLLSDLRGLYERLNGVVFVALLMLGGLLFLSWWLAGKLQRPISVPLLSLVETMASISQSKDFTLRAEKEGRDEIGQLVDGFNSMLEQVETHRHELVTHQQGLERTVEKRTDELRQMVWGLERAKQQAEAASEAKSQFLASITHELRTPLIGVLGMNELLFRTSLDGQQKMLATTVQKSGADLLALINNVLDYSKIEAGKMQLVEAEFALYRTVDEVFDLLAGSAVEKGLSLSSHIPLSATCRVLGDATRIRQIMMNLIGNAIKFTEQGSVTVKLDCTFPQVTEAVFTVEVIDTGIGIPEEAQQQIFSAFCQADGTDTRKYGGTGLGLAIVQQLVQLLDGSLRLESSTERGSCFKVSFSLPFVAPTEIKLPETLQQQAVLVYAADADCRQLLTSRLQELGLSVAAASSAEDSWYQLCSAERSGTPFKLLFFPVDAFLPSGQSLCSAIRAERTFSSLRRIILLKRLQSADLQKQEHKLYLPIGWDALAETLCQCWHELHLVEKPLTEDHNAHVEVSSSDFELLLAGGSLASQELIKVLLVDAPVAVAVAKDLSQLEERVAQNIYAAILLDLSTFSAELLLDYCQRRQTKIPLIILCTASDNVAPLQPFIAEVIEKPFKRDQFLSLLQSLLNVDFSSSAKALGEGGGNA